MAAETITNAKSGHTGIALGCATIMYALFKDHYFYDVKDPKFIGRDRFVMSAGHGSAIYYATAHLFNFGTSMDDLKNFRKFESKTPGHPEVDATRYVEASTGPLGQGIANAVGMAIGQSISAEKFNAQKCPVFDNYIYCLCGDGCLMEGVATEAISLAGTLKLNKLILLYDCNKITIDGKLDIANTEKVERKFKAMGWNVIVCNDSHLSKTADRPELFSRHQWNICPYPQTRRCRERNSMCRSAIYSAVSTPPWAEPHRRHRARKVRRPAPYIYFPVRHIRVPPQWEPAI